MHFRHIGTYASENLTVEGLITKDLELNVVRILSNTIIIVLTKQIFVSALQ